MTLFDNRYDNLSHYGVKGMHWGVRKDRRSGSGKIGSMIKKKEKHLSMYESEAKAIEAKGAKKAAAIRSEAAEFLKGYDKAVDDVALKSHAKFLKDAKGKSKTEIDAIEKKSIAKANKKIVEIQAEKKQMAADWEAAAKKVEAKAARKAKEYRTEAEEQRIEWDKAIENVNTKSKQESTNRGKAFARRLLVGPASKEVNIKNFARHNLAPLNLYSQVATDYYDEWK